MAVEISFMRGSCSDRLINRRLEIAMLRLLRNFRAIYPALDSQLGIYNKIINNTRRETVFPSRVSSAIFQMKKRYDGRIRNVV